jgi:flagellar motor switch protein FliG
MKKHITLLMVLFSLIPVTIMAQDKIYSLAVKEHDIEMAIHSALKPYLDKGDYIVKAKIKGSRATERIKQKSTTPTRSTGNELPGFEIEEQSAQTDISDIIGDSYWKIEKIQVDMIMHKTISSSVDTYIRKTVPVIAELDPNRGDIFKFDPITPKSQDEDPANLTKEEKVKVLSEEVAYYGLTWKEWVYLGLFTFLLLFVVVILWRFFKMKKNLTSLVDAIEGDDQAYPKNETQELLSELQKVKEDRLKKQEEQLSEELLKGENDKITRDIITQLVGRSDFAEQIVDEYGNSKEGIDKITKLIAILGPNISRKIFANAFGKEQYLKLEEISLDISVNPNEEKDLLREIQKILFTKQLLEPESRTQDPFKFLYELSSDQITFLVKPEPTKIKAIILSRLNSIVASEIIARLPKEERGQVVVLLGKMQELSGEVMEKVAYDLAAKAQGVPDSDAASFDGVNMVVDVMGDAGPEIRNDIINSLRVSDRKLSTQVENKFFLFDSIPVVPQEILSAVVRKLPTEEVIRAINNASKQLQEKVILCFPLKIRRTLVASLKSQSPEPDAIRKARKLIVREMQLMGEEKRIDLRKVLSDWEKVSSSKSSA